MTTPDGDTHSKAIGYTLWIFGFTGSHRFYYGKPVTGTIYFFTLGLLLIGWIVDLFLIPSMDRKADLRFRTGIYDYNVAWVLLTFLGVFGIHRFYMGKWFTGILYLLTGGLFLIGYIYDLWTLNDQVNILNGQQ
ncbi:MAG: TM2 domain-containing protein [Deltaproteobacteria bacterium]|nr:TM2 domain-containing protein [Deltaproteobacteria bacterium]